MRVRLSVQVANGSCAVCGVSEIPVIPFTLVVDDHAGETDRLCERCLFGVDGLAVTVPMEPLAPGPPSRRKALRKNKELSKEQEVDIAEELGGRTQPGSGNQPGAKGDVRVKGEFRVEGKFTFANSFSLQLDDLYKITSECGDGEKPVLVIDFRDAATKRMKDRFAVMHFIDLKELVDAARKYR